MINALSQIHRETVSPTLPPSVCASLLQWHKIAQKEKVPWKRLEALVLGEESPQKTTTLFKAGTKLLRSYQGKSHLVIITDDKKAPFLYEG